jgi:acyl dehydratase
MSTLPDYQATAVNTATEHENRIHSAAVASRYGFEGGLVPGVNVYGYLTVPVVRSLGREWLDRGWMRIRFRKPFYDGELVTVRATQRDGNIAVDAERASAEAGLHNEAPPMPLFEHPLPEQRPLASDEVIVPGAALGSFSADLTDSHKHLVVALGDPSEHYLELAHPTVLLGLANDILVRNFVLPAWIHTASDVRHYRAARADETVSVRGRIRDVFADKGHKFLIAEVTIVDQNEEILQHVVHIAIWKLRES